MRHRGNFAGAALGLAAMLVAFAAHAGEVRVSFSPSAAARVAELGLEVPATGRLFVILSRDGSEEPRLGTGVTGNPLWAIDVRDFSAGDTVAIRRGRSGFRGYPLADLADVPAGEYVVQPFLSIYTRFERADGHVIEAHMNSGAFQKVFESPGNVTGKPQTVTVGSDGLDKVDLTLDRVIEPDRPLGPGEVLQQGNFEDTRWVKYVKIRSEALSRFWGTDMYVGANVLLPPGYDEAGDRLPVLYMQGHSSGLTPMPWAPEEWFEPGYTPDHPAVGRQLDGFYEAWTSGQLPKMVVVTFRDANPFFDTSYSVNSPNVGPYRDALIEELLPVLEERFRIADEPGGRVLAGRSTGGWEAAAMMIFDPDLFAGAFVWAPDPIDFRKLMQIDIYQYANAFTRDLGWIQVPLPAQRETDGLVNYFVRDEYAYEQTVGDRDRSGGQWAIWQAVYSPVGADGYPKPLWDPQTGRIDPAVARHWQEHWDLGHILERDWPSLGPRLKGKLHFAVGRMDNYYLEEAVYLTEARLQGLADPAPDATFQYGDRGRHSWIGHSPDDPERQMTYAEFIGVVSDFLQGTYPPHADP